VIILAEYDSVYRALPHVPFIIELPTLCYIVEVPLCKAQQNKYLQYFELIQVSIRGNEVKNVGYKCADFLAYSSGFELIGGCYTTPEAFLELMIEWEDSSTVSRNGIFFEPYGWKAQLESEISDPYLSLDETPATGFEAWEIYSAYKTWQYQVKINKITDDLNNNRIKPEYIKNRLPELYQHYQQSKRINSGLDFSLLEQAIVRHALKDIPIKEKKCSRQLARKGEHKDKAHGALSNINLIESYFYTLANHPEPQRKKEEIRQQTLVLFYPELTDDEIKQISESLERKINRLLKEDESILRWKYLALFQ
jgi:hypothetical protein